MLLPADMDIGINRPAVQAQDVIRQEGIEVGPGEERLGHLPAGDVIHLGLPVVLQADDEAHVMGFAGPEPGQTGIGEVGEQAIAPPGLVDLQGGCHARGRG